MLNNSLLYGRSLLKEEMDFEINDEERKSVIIEPAFIKKDGKRYCSRCHTRCMLKRPYPCVCSSQCYYCRECISMGKVRECASLYSLPEPNRFDTLKKPCLHWNGTLSKQQAEAAECIKQSMEMAGDRIVWAVAGAGKTEMLFEGISSALEKGKRVCVAAPRIDVILELAPRFQAVFPEVSLSVLYGGAEEHYTYTQIVIATTHQLYRFKEAFDVMIIDEIDAFPYHMNAALNYAADKARKKQSSMIYLTATPDKPMQKDIKTKKIEASVLPARYHGHPLPVPKGCYEKQALLNCRRIEKLQLIRHMIRLTENGKQFLVFIPTITLMEKLLPMFNQLFDPQVFESVHSKDTYRKEKVMKMRKGSIQFLLTTTILERGVTFKNIDVIVIHADHHVYTESALVQISGRVGRSPDYPSGEVTFYHQGWTKAMKRAVRQIRAMNRLSREKGYVR